MKTRRKARTTVPLMMLFKPFAGRTEIHCEGCKWNEHEPGYERVRLREVLPRPRKKAKR